MAKGSAQLHEPTATLSPETLARHRALASLMEELEAIDWYDQRIDATGDPDLAAILAHNRDEEKEHAAMVLEWLRRRDPALDGFLRRYLFTDASITEVASAAEADPARGNGVRVSLAIGDLRDKQVW